MRKYGKFSIHKELIDKAINNEVHRGDLQSILANFLILRAEMDFCSNSIEYIAFSDLFEEVEEGCISPSYTLFIAEIPAVGIPIEDGITRLSFLRVEKL